MLCSRSQLQILLGIVAFAAMSVPSYAQTRWTGDGDGENWWDGQNWSEGVPPTTGAVEIPKPDDHVFARGGPKIDISDLSCGGSLTLVGQQFEVSGLSTVDGNLTIVESNADFGPLDGNGLVVSGELTLMGCTLQSDAPIIANGNVSWLASTITGQGRVQMYASVLISTTGDYVPRNSIEGPRIFETFGAVLITGVGVNFFGASGVEWYNFGHTNVQTETDFSAMGIINDGTFLTIRDSALRGPLTNHGLFQVENCKFLIEYGEDTINEADIEINGTDSELSIRSRTTLAEGSSVSGNGELILEAIGGGSWIDSTDLPIEKLTIKSCASPVYIDSNATIRNLALLDDGWLYGSGTVTVSESMSIVDWAKMGGDGTTIVSEDADLSINLSSRFELLEIRTFILDGTGAFFGDGVWTGSTDANFAISTTGLMTVSGNPTTTGQFVFTNEGTMIQIGGASDFGQRHFYCPGHITIESGTMRFTTYGTMNGTFLVNAPATFLLECVSQVFPTGSLIEGEGTLFVKRNATFEGDLDIQTVIINGGNAVATFDSDVMLRRLMIEDGDLRGTGTVNVATSFLWNGGSMLDSGITELHGPTVIDNIGSIYLGSGRLLRAYEPVIWSGTGNLRVTGDNLFQIVGTTFDVRSSADCSWNIENRGTVLRSPGTPGTTRFLRSFVSVGSIIAASGTMSFYEKFQQIRGQTRIEGGSIREDGGLVLDFEGGGLSGYGTITGDVVTDLMLVDPGTTDETGALTIAGTYTQGSDSTLKIDIGGTTPGTQYDALNISGGPASLAGTLKVSLVDGFVPRLGDAFRILTAGTITDRFDSIRLPRLPRKHRWAVEYGSGSVVLRVVERIPESVDVGR